MKMLLGKGYCFIKFLTVFGKNRGELFCDEVRVSTFFHKIWSSKKSQNPLESSSC